MAVLDDLSTPWRLHIHINISMETSQKKTQDYTVYLTKQLFVLSFLMLESGGSIQPAFGLQILR